MKKSIKKIIEYIVLINIFLSLFIIFVDIYIFYSYETVSNKYRIIENVSLDSFLSSYPVKNGMSYIFSSSELDMDIISKEYNINIDKKRIIIPTSCIIKILKKYDLSKIINQFSLKNDTGIFHITIFENGMLIINVFLTCDNTLFDE